MRVPARIPVTLRCGKRTLELTTVDVGHGGLFVHTDDAMQLRQLVEVRLTLPTDQRPFVANGCLVHQRTLGKAEDAAGLGVQFYGVGRDDQLRWDLFVREAIQAAGKQATGALAHGRLLDDGFARDAAHAGTFRVELESSDDLLMVLRRDILRGALFFACNANIGIGERVGLEIVHPEGGDVFVLEGRVRRLVDDDGVDGLEVKLALEGDKRQRFEEFVYDAILPPPEV